MAKEKKLVLENLILCSSRVSLFKASLSTRISSIPSKNHDLGTGRAYFAFEWLSINKYCAVLYLNIMYMTVYEIQDTMRIFVVDVMLLLSCACCVKKFTHHHRRERLQWILWLTDDGTQNRIYKQTSSLISTFSSAKNGR